MDPLEGLSPGQAEEWSVLGPQPDLPPPGVSRRSDDSPVGNGGGGSVGAAGNRRPVRGQGGRRKRRP